MPPAPKLDETAVANQLARHLPGWTFDVEHQPGRDDGPGRWNVIAFTPAGRIVNTSIPASMYRANPDAVAHVYARHLRDLEDAQLYNVRVHRPAPAGFQPTGSRDLND